MDKPVMHILQPMPRKGGNSFYRDKTDYTKFVKTLCGAPLTDMGQDFHTAGTKVFAKWLHSAEYQQFPRVMCPECVRLRTEKA